MRQTTNCNLQSMSIVTQAVLTRKNTLISLCQDGFANGTVADSIAEGGMCAHVWEMPLERFERYSVVSLNNALVPQLQDLC
jgi:hypothetical protein